MQTNLSGKWVLITGASSGIGQCIAEQAVTAGSQVVLAARSADKLQWGYVKSAYIRGAWAPTIENLPRSGMASRAFKQRLMSICCICAASMTPDSQHAVVR